MLSSLNVLSSFVLFLASYDEIKEFRLGRKVLILHIGIIIGRGPC